MSQNQQFISKPFCLDVRLKVSTPEILLIIPHCTDKLCGHTHAHRSTEDLLSTPGGTRVCLTLKAFCKQSPEKPRKIEIAEDSICQL